MNCSSGPSPSDPNDQQGLDAEMAERPLDVRDLYRVPQGPPGSTKIISNFNRRSESKQTSNPGSETEKPVHLPPGILGRTFCIQTVCTKKAIATILQNARKHCLSVGMQSASLKAEKVSPLSITGINMYSMRFDVRVPRILILRRSQDASSRLCTSLGCVFHQCGLGIFTNDPRAGKLLPCSGGREQALSFNGPSCLHIAACRKA